MPTLPEIELLCLTPPDSRSVSTHTYYTNERYDYWSLESGNWDAEETGLPVVRRESVLGLREESRIRRQIQASQPINITRTIDPVIDNAFSIDDKSRQCRLCSLPEQTAEVKLILPDGLSRP
jgi:hypothetical protein